jgi:hypothetical protein
VVGIALVNEELFARFQQALLVQLFYAGPPGGRKEAMLFQDGHIRLHDAV